MILSKYLQQCLTFTLGFALGATAATYRHYILDFLKPRPIQNSKEKFTKKRYKFDVWTIYSGSESLKWIINVLKPNIEDKCNQRIAIDLDCEIPGKIKLDTFLEIAEKTNKVIIVLGPEENENKWFQYQFALALEERDPRKVLVCYLGEIIYQDQISGCLQPIQTIRLSYTPDISLQKIYEFVTKSNL